MDFFHPYIQRKTKNDMGFLKVNTKNLCTFFNFGEWVGEELVLFYIYFIFLKNLKNGPLLDFLLLLKPK
jgi:hypothetical protein